MKLFSPAEVGSRNSQQVTRDILRIQEVKEELKRQEMNLANSEAQFSESLVRQKEKWAQEIETHIKEKSAMEQEVRALESRRKQALIPIEFEREKAQNVLREAQELLQKSKEKEIHLDVLQESLEKRLDDVSERELNLSSEEKALEMKQLAILHQQKTVNENTKALSESIQKFNDYVQVENDKIQQGKKEIFLEQQSIQARKEMLDRREEELHILSIQLEDGRKTLQRAFQRINMENQLNEQPITSSEETVVEPTVETPVEVVEQVSPVEETSSEESSEVLTQ